MEDKSEYLAQLRELESQISKLKFQLQPESCVDPNAPDSFKCLVAYLGRALKFVVSNTGFVTFVLTIIVAGWAAWRYDIGPFEGQQNIATRRASADIYTRIGNELLLKGEFSAAKDAYQKALEINPNNVKAMHGLVSMRVIEPLAGQKEPVPEVVDIRLGQLKSLLDPDEDFIVPYLEAERYYDQKDYKKAEKSYEAAIQKNKDFIHAYVAKAYVSILNEEGVDASLVTLERVPEEKRKKSPLILANLGFCYLARDVVTKDLSKAIVLLKESLISPYFETYLDLGDAHRYMGDIGLALENHQKAFELVREDRNENENSVFGNLAINLMPEAFDDKKTSERFVEVSTMDEKRVLAYFALSFDYALLGRWDKANQKFESGFQLDETHKYYEFMVNKIKSIKEFSKNPLKRPARNWFDRQIKRLIS